MEYEDCGEDPIRIPSLLGMWTASCSLPCSQHDQYHQRCSGSVQVPLAICCAHSGPPSSNLPNLLGPLHKLSIPSHSTGSAQQAGADTWVPLIPSGYHLTLGAVQYLCTLFFLKLDRGRGICCQNACHVNMTQVWPPQYIF